MSEHYDLPMTQHETTDEASNLDEATRVLANEVRGLVAEINRLSPDAGLLTKARALVSEARNCISSPERPRWYEVPLDEIDDPLENRLRAEARDHSLYRGRNNPLAPPLSVTTELNEQGVPLVIGSVCLDRSWEGPPRRVHGGYVAGLFDDVLSGTPGLVDAGPVVTARLEVRFRRATPINAPLRFEALVVRHSGRRVVARARCLAPDDTAGQEKGLVVTAEAEALFVSVPRHPNEARSER